MKYILITLIACTPLFAQNDFHEAYKERRGKTETPNEEAFIEKYIEGSKKVADEQDELSADIQELIQEETNEKVIQFLSQAEQLMAEATDNLENNDTSGATIAIETEIIEKIANAAKQKQQSSSNPQQSEAMMQMLQQMMGQKKSSSQSNKAGKSKAGDSGTPSETSSNDGSPSGSTTHRVLPKKSGTAGTVLPKEFQKALDAYNKALNQK